MLVKAQSLAVDLVVVDLEDSVDVADKNDETRAAVAAALTATWRARALAVRVNGLQTEWGLRDLEALVAGAGHHLAAIVLPKVESANEIKVVDRVLTRLERELDLRRDAIWVDALIETARGLVEVERIAAASPRLRALVFGPGDYAASIGAASAFIGANAEAEDDPLLYARQRLVTAARAFALAPIDGPYGDVKDAEGLRLAARRARRLGFDGKWAIHPGQIEICTEAFTPSAAELTRARATLAALAAAGGGAASVSGVMVDAASARAAAATLARAGADGAS